jgi:hypothetical protein
MPSQVEQTSDLQNFMPNLRAGNRPRPDHGTVVGART